jgi:hypothetical protein
MDSKRLETAVRPAALLAELDVALMSMPAPKRYRGKHRAKGPANAK